MLHAKDDPMVPMSTLGAIEDASDAITFVESEHGGHVGWFGGVSEKAFIDGWAMEQICAFAQI